MTFEIIDKITNIEIIAIGNKIREIASLREEFGQARWRKLKGETTARLLNGRIRRVEVHSLLSEKRNRDCAEIAQTEKRIDLSGGDSIDKTFA